MRVKFKSLRSEKYYLFYGIILSINLNIKIILFCFFYFKKKSFFIKVFFSFFLKKNLNIFVFLSIQKKKEKKNNLNIFNFLLIILQNNVLKFRLLLSRKQLFKENNRRVRAINKLDEGLLRRQN